MMVCDPHQPAGLLDLLVQQIDLPCQARSPLFGVSLDLLNVPLIALIMAFRAAFSAATLSAIRRLPSFQKSGTLTLR
jgi:hypothetical protein